MSNKQNTSFTTLSSLETHGSLCSNIVNQWFAVSYELRIATNKSYYDTAKYALFCSLRASLALAKDLRQTELKEELTFLLDILDNLN